jgi:hypothetical protein
MEDHETRRKIIREWMALPRDKRHTEEQVVAFAKRATQAKRVPSQSARSGPSISARSVPESYGMALASRWKVIAAWQAGRRCGGRRLWAMAHLSRHRSTFTPIEGELAKWIT